ncbi:hypothetical protein [Sphingomonas sp. PvP056]|uniref:hypothetical protein n=1 Tax=Sphingomonas sp. PvP056 TaxID=3156392 RepID=UPI003390C898
MNLSYRDSRRNSFAKDVIITAPTGALRRSVKEFGWNDQISLSRQPGLFYIFDQQAA